MTSKDELRALADRVEGLAGPDRAADHWIFMATAQRDAANYWHPTEGHRYTASLDAAMSLVPTDAFWRVGHDGEGPDPSDFRADVLLVPGARHIARSATPALALTAAALRAIAETAE